MTDTRAALLEAIASDLDALMCARSLTQRGLRLRASGVSEGTISRVLRARDCRLSTLARLASAMGLRVSVIFHEKETP